MELKATIQLKPCNHAACDKCIESWMLNSTSFAQTIRTGKSVTTCPLCRATVQDTVALAASALAASEEGNLDGAPSEARRREGLEGPVDHSRLAVDNSHVQRARAVGRGEGRLGGTAGGPYEVFLSLRLSEAMNEAMALQQSLEARGVRVFLCDEAPGANLLSAIKAKYNAGRHSKRR